MDGTTSRSSLKPCSTCLHFCSWPVFWHALWLCITTAMVDMVIPIPMVIMDMSMITTSTMDSMITITMIITSRNRLLEKVQRLFEFTERQRILSLKQESCPNCIFFL
ncbi:hypothetical protein TNIN_268531 [Trichonephila inaurata madagascariensis]|uniref:Uncharacterized protein n=1 Tax=Trichonephila inaurata madagascariensis TaxID=2747483 RepID=A0A8X7CNB3_9ARAC|nr:hypothetical protein TNIN_268531 [Trichonephila inaurata madagascariensis]